MRNYDTTLGLPYIRVDALNIDYGSDHITVSLIEGESVVLGGAVRRLDTDPTHYQFRLPLNPDTLLERHPLRNYNTGEPLPEGTVSLGEVMMGMLAIIRSQQLKRDAIESPVEQP